MSDVILLHVHLFSSKYLHTKFCLFLSLLSFFFFNEIQRAHYFNETALVVIRARYLRCHHIFFICVILPAGEITSGKWRRIPIAQAGLHVPQTFF